MADPRIKINVRNLMITVMSSAGGLLEPVARKEAEAKVFNPACDKLKKDFENHPITQEIEAGIGADNISDTLGDFDTEDGGKNLFSFIGFEDGSDPIGTIRKYFDKNDPDGPKLELEKINKDEYKFTYKAMPPNSDDLYADSPMPWAEGISWVKRIEVGIPGLGHFLNRFNINASRSGGGIQITGQLPNRGQFKRKMYISSMIAKFLQRINSYKG